MQIGRMNRRVNSIGRMNVRRRGDVEIEVMVYPSDDTCVFSATSTNYGNSDILYIRSGQRYPLIRFDLSSIPASSSILSAKFKFENLLATISGINLYQISDANGDWIEGTKNGSLAGVGEPSWIAKEGDGSGGVLTPWAGSAGLSIAGTDYIDTILMDNTVSYAVGVHETAINSDGLAVIQSWFGLATNNGLLLKPGGGNSYIASKENTIWQKPMLTIVYS